MGKHAWKQSEVLCMYIVLEQSSMVLSDLHESVSEALLFRDG